MLGLDTVFGFVGSLSLVSLVFISVILVTAGYFNLRYNARVAELGPTILTTIGIFGTFLGVALGLYHFDASNVQASVPALLAGLKTAFWASVFGVGAAVQIKAREFLFGGGASSEDGQQQGASPLDVLIDIRDSLCGTDGPMSEQLRLIRQDLNDRLLSQVRLARQDMTERMDTFRTGHRDMLAQMDKLAGAQAQALRDIAGMGTQALVEALQKVVTDFNDTVAGQFGENYRELNEAVRQLLRWQIDYREQVKAMTDQLAETLRLLGYAASDFKTVTQGSERFAQTAERVARTLDGIDAGEQRLTELARGIAKLTEEAAGRVPFIESRLYELTVQMTRAVQANQEILHAALTQSAADMRQAMASSQAALTDTARAGAEQLRDNQAAIAAALADNATAMSGALKATQDKLLAAVAGFDQETASLIGRGQDRVLQLDGQMAETLTKSIEKLAQQLSAQVDAAGERLAGEIVKPRPALRLVAEAGGED
jgi:hypothetical protein